MRASNRSISGEERPTREPSWCTGPGCDSPGQVHADKRWPGSMDCTKTHVRGSAGVGIENIRNICSQDNLHARGHHSPRPRWGLYFQDRPGPEEYQHHRNHNCRATENRFRNGRYNTERQVYQAIDTSTETGTAFRVRSNQYIG